jgi:hypothetical protein
VFASGHTRTPEGVVQLVHESVESFRLDGRDGNHGRTGCGAPARVVQDRREIFGDRAIQVYDNVLIHINDPR